MYRWFRRVVSAYISLLFLKFYRSKFSWGKSVLKFVHVAALISLVWISRHSFASPRAKVGAGQAPMATLLFSSLSIPSTQKQLCSEWGHSTVILLWTLTFVLAAVLAGTHVRKSSISHCIGTTVWFLFCSEPNGHVPACNHERAWQMSFWDACSQLWWAAPYSFVRSN